MNELLDKIRNLNFTDSVAVKNTLAEMVHRICDEKQGSPREITTVETTLATRALNLNTNDLDEMRLLLLDMCKELGSLTKSTESTDTNDSQNR